MPPFINKHDSDNNVFVELQLQKHMLQQLKKDVAELSEDLEKSRREIYSMKEKNANQMGRDAALGFFVGTIFIAALQFIIPRVFETSSNTASNMAIVDDICGDDELRL